MGNGQLVLIAIKTRLLTLRIVQNATDSTVADYLENQINEL